MQQFLPTTNFQRLLACGTLLLMGFTLFGFLGKFYWVFDLCTHFRCQYCGILLLLLAGFGTLRNFRWMSIIGVLAVINLVTIFPLYFGNLPDEADAFHFKLISLNVYRLNREYDRVLNFIKQENPDVALFLEVDPVWGEKLRQLDKDYPYSAVSPEQGNFGFALFSKIPLENISYEDLGSHNLAVFAELICPTQKVQLVGAHPFPPRGAIPSRIRNEQLQQLARLINGREHPVILAGDMNTTSWSFHFQKFISATDLNDSRHGFGVQPTWPADNFLLRVPIDHCLVSSGIVVTNRAVGPQVGSDHLPVIVELSVPQHR